MVFLDLAINMRHANSVSVFTWGDERAAAQHICGLCQDEVDWKTGGSLCKCPQPDSFLTTQAAVMSSVVL